MGLAIYPLSRILLANGLDSSEKLLEKIESRQLPEVFLHVWDEFMENYGFGGYRESNKYNLILGNDLIRREILKRGEKLVFDGRLDEVGQIFSLKIAGVGKAIQNLSLDLQKLVKDRTHYFDQIKNIKNFPRLIDLRGTIFRPHRKESGSGEIVGQGVAAGIAKGPVKVLHMPDEKNVLPGDILVTRTTDPGWTPLFINAVALVLEVGGMSQHGALVAREYGKPCVVGIDTVASFLEDGQ